MKKHTIAAILLALVCIISGCSHREKTDTTSTSPSAGESETKNHTVTTNNASIDVFTDRDLESDYDSEKSVLITLQGDSAMCDSDAVQISGSTITIIDEGTYVLRGTLNDGMIIIDSEKTDKTQLVLDGVTIHSETSAPIYVLQSDKVFIALAEGSDNTLSNGGSFEAIDENNIDAVIFSKEDITLNGSGNLTITSPAGHGIVSKDELTITGGTYTIDAASHGIAGKDNVCIVNAFFAITSGKDGIHAENADDAELGFVYIAGGSFEITAEGDGVSAGAYMQIEDGTFDIVCGGGSVNGEKQTSDSWGGFMGGGRGGRMGGNSSQQPDSEDSTSIKGIKATGDLTINAGTFTIDSADDAVHSNVSVTVSGGTFEIASGDDGFHADDTLTFLGGTVNITESYEGIEGLDIDVSDGKITLVASDDGLNAAGGTDQSGFGGRGNDQFGRMGGGGSSNGSIQISGGELSITASGDGIDANGTLTISGGYTTVCGPTQGDTATLDYDSSAIITGGTFIGTGASNMAQTFSDSEQGVIALNVGNQSAGTQITLTDQNGKTVVSYKPELSFGVVILSTPDMVKGENYSITVGSASGEFSAN